MDMVKQLHLEKK